MFDSYLLKASFTRLVQANNIPYYITLNRLHHLSNN